MAKFQKKRGKAMPAISTASLPDIVFMLLFFFMVVTVIKNADLMVDVVVPKVERLDKLEDKDATVYFYVGAPSKKFQSEYGSAPRLQVNDAFRNVEDIIRTISEKKEGMNELQKSKLAVSLRVDKDITMGIVGDIKIELRKANARKINYAAVKGAY